MTTYMGWHWMPESRELRYGNGGRTLGTYDLCHEPGTPVLCERGLHWSDRVIDALEYAPGSMLCRVQCWGETVRGNDKAASEYRQIRWWIDAEHVLWAWLCDIAEDALLLTGINERASWAAVELRREWLDGRDVNADQWAAAEDAAWARAAARDAGDAAEDAARDAAGAAAWAARDAAEDAAWARAAARDAAGAAAWAARAAARAAAGAAAWAAGAAAWAARDAAEDAAWARAAARDAGDAAEDAARDAQNERLEAMIRAEARRLHIAEWAR